jgi:hypothetical protein
MVRKSTAVHKNNEYKVFKPNSLFCNNKNIRNACPKLPALTVVNNLEQISFVILKIHKKFLPKKYFINQKKASESHHEVCR